MGTAPSVGTNELAKDQLILNIINSKYQNLNRNMHEKKREIWQNIELRNNSIMFIEPSLIHSKIDYLTQKLPSKYSYEKNSLEFIS